MYLSEINAPFIALETLLFITLTLFTTDFLSIAKYYLTSVTLTFTFSLTLCCLLLIVLKLCRTTYSGYIMILFQYGGFLVILLLSKDLLTYLLFFQKTTSINLFLSIVQMSFFLPTVIIGSIVLSLIAFVLFDLIFLQNMYKIIDFEHNKLFYSKKYLFHIRMPYFFLERKRYYANKELWFYTILKNVVLFILLYKFITTTYSLNKTLINMVVIIFLCSINPFSVVAYSSDPHINKLVLITPIDSYKVYLSKVHMSFLLNFIIVLSFIVLNCFFMPDGNNTIFLILYGLANNYCHKNYF